MDAISCDAAKTEQRVIVIVLDGLGVGPLPDAGDYGDEGANTFLHVHQQHKGLKIPKLIDLGLEQTVQIAKGMQFSEASSHKAGYYGCLGSLSSGKDTTSGHWELAGVVLKKPLPLYPHGFPAEIISAFEGKIGRKVLGNFAASGTEIIKELGDLHLQTGRPIVYTSADSVFQIAAHDEVVPGDLLYEWCKTARDILQDDHGVGRVIARPFTGSSPDFKRTAGRRDYSLAPPEPTLLDRVSEAGLPVAVIGKVSDIFDHRGVTIHRPGKDNTAVAESLQGLIREIQGGLLWATFGDFDTLYGHRNDAAGFARALEHFDHYLSSFMTMMRKNDLLLITADHGCDPTHPGTDHTREYVPLLAWSPTFTRGVNLGIRLSKADAGAGAAQWLNIGPLQQGVSFLERA